MDETIAIHPISEGNNEKFGSEHARATTSAARMGCIATVLGAIIAVVGPFALQKYGGDFFRSRSSKRGASRKNRSILFEFEPSLNAQSVVNAAIVHGKCDRLPTNQDVWIFVCPNGKQRGRLFGPAQIFRNGTWKSGVQLQPGQNSNLSVTAILVKKKQQAKMSKLSKNEQRLAKIGVKYELLAEKTL